MDFSADSRWISFLEHDLLSEQLGQAEDEILWDQDSLHSLENDGSRGDPCCQDNFHQKKRSQNETYNGAASKACREKMRRDKLNDRFMELSAILEPDKPPKTDKASILRDATRIMIQLRAEVQQLKEANKLLQESVKELKSEKLELRDEKLMLKSEKESMEKQLKSVRMVPGYVVHPAAVHAAVVHPHASKGSPYLEVPIAPTMSQWMPPSVVDISNDHVLRPPVA